jgi:DNA-binding NarL/FixJ family response regulator
VGLIPNGRLILFDEGLQLGGLTTDSGPPPAAAAMIDFFDGLASDDTKIAGSGDLETVLSAREIEVLRLVSAGKSNQQIADELVISFNTVQRHVSNILDKTGTTNRTEAARYARDRSLA